MLEKMSLRAWVKRPKIPGEHVIDMEGKTPHHRKAKALPRRVLSIQESFDRDGESVVVCMYTRELLKRADDNDYDACKAMLEQGADIHVRDEETGFTALHIVAKNGTSDILELLLNNGADCNAQDINGLSPLHIAATKDRFSCCDILLKCPRLDINIRSNTHETPLHHAAKEGRDNICTLILQHENVEINAKNKKFMTPLHLAVLEKHNSVIQILMEKNADPLIPDKKFYLPIHYAAQEGCPKSCEALLTNTSDETRKKQLEKRLQDRKTPLMLAAKGGNSKCCATLTDITIDEVDSKGNTALHFATVEGFEKTVAQLLKMGASPNAGDDETGSATVLEAAGKKKIGCLKLLVDYGAHLDVVDQENKNVYHYAAEKNAVECLKYLLTLPVPRSLMDKEDNNNCTPLYLAFKHNAEECAQILLENGASPVEQCSAGMTPLHLAAGKGFKSICAMLLAQDEVQVNQENDKKETPLHLAARYGSKDICQKLLSKGARLSALNEEGKTALHIASQNGHANVVKFLSKRGAPQQGKDDTGYTALHLAASKGSMECCKVLGASAKILCGDVYQNRNLPLDRAFEKKHDNVFKFLLMKLPFDDSHEEKMLQHQKLQKQHLYEQEKQKLENQRDRMLCLHRYMHAALYEKRLTVVEAIIDSSWWHAGFIGRNGHFCKNFRLLIECHPALALKVQNKCVRAESESKVVYNFKLLEDNYYIPGAAGEIAKNPYEDEGGRVCRNAQQFVQDSLEWKNLHPLSLMVSHTRHRLLHHPLTNAWLLHKWRSYISAIFIALLFLKLLIIASLTIFMGTVDNWSLIKSQCGFTREQFCNISETLLQDQELDRMPEPLKEGIVTGEDTHSLARFPENATIMKFAECNGAIFVKRQMYWVLVMTTLITVLLECNHIYRSKEEYLILANFLQVLHIILTIVLLVPEGNCELHHRILGVGQWQSGILALLIGWLQLIDMLNQLPFFSVFMPITRSFLRSFFKVLLYITMLVFVFAFIFHLLLKDQDPFLTVPEAMVKTIVWMLGDLGYDAIFHNKEHQLPYPVMVNILFVVFVTTIGGFIANMIITQPSQKLDDFREKAAFYRTAIQCRMILRYDVCFPFFHKYKTRGTFIDDETKTYGASFLTKKILMLNAEDEEGENVSPLQLYREQSKNIATLMKLQNEQSEELFEIKHQLNIITKSILQ